MSEAKESKTFTLEEVAQHNTSESLWLVVSGRVYDVTSFMEEHPGGEEVLLEVAGMDATVSFEDVGHSPDAREQQKKYLIGEISGSKAKKVQKNTTPNAPETASVGYVWIVLVFMVVAVALGFYLNYS